VKRDKIVEGIFENLEFETLMDVYPDTYKIECKEGVKVLDILVHNVDNDTEFAIAYGTIGKVRDRDYYVIKINCGKKFWEQRYDTLGAMVDNTDNMIAFIKEACKDIIKAM